jgi:hypothetical protein
MRECQGADIDELRVAHANQTASISNSGFVLHDYPFTVFCGCLTVILYCEVIVVRLCEYRNLVIVCLTAHFLFLEN